MSEAFRSRLADYHLAQGATLGEYHGAIVPVRFSEAAAEYRALREASGLLDLAFRAKFAMKGRDAQRFLHRIVSNDIKSLAPGQGTYAALLNAQGHILADLRIYVCEDRILIDTDADLRDKAMTTLRRYIIGEAVEAEAVELDALGFEGPRARGLLEKTLHIELPELGLFGHFETPYAGIPIRVVKASQTGENGYEVWTETKGLMTVWGAACGRAPSDGTLPCGTEAIEALRIEAGIPRYGSELGEDTLPLEAGLWNALSFNKGCYVGQEIVERSRSRGHVNWKLAGLAGQTGAPLARGEKLEANGREMGEITSASFSWRLGKPIALGYVRREVAEPGTLLATAGGAAVEVRTLPFSEGAQAGREAPGGNES